MAKKRKKKSGGAAARKGKDLFAFIMPSRDKAPAKESQPMAKKSNSEGKSKLGAGMVIQTARRHAAAAAGGMLGLVYDVAAQKTETTADDKAAWAVKLGAAAGLDYLGGDLRNAGLGLTGQNAAHELEARIVTDAMRRAIAEQAAKKAAADAAAKQAGSVAGK